MKNQNLGRFIKVFRQSSENWDDVRTVGVLLSFGTKTMMVRSITGECLIHTMEIDTTYSEIISTDEAMEYYKNIKENNNVK